MTLALKVVLEHDVPITSRQDSLMVDRLNRLIRLSTMEELTESIVLATRVYSERSETARDPIVINARLLLVPGGKVVIENDHYHREEITEVKKGANFLRNFMLSYSSLGNLCAKMEKIKP